MIPSVHIVGLVYIIHVNNGLQLGVLSLHVACENGNAMMISCFLKAGEGPLLGGTHRSYNDHGSLVNAKGGEKVYLHLYRGSRPETYISVVIA